MPPDTIYVGRGTIHGNPFRVGKDGTAQECVELFEHNLRGTLQAPIMGMALRKRLDQLRGKNLACWCKPGEPCHTDVLLEYANGEAPAKEGQ
jgi:hypothetical protein